MQRNASPDWARRGISRRGSRGGAELGTFLMLIVDTCDEMDDAVLSDVGSDATSVEFDLKLVVDSGAIFSAADSIFCGFFSFFFSERLFFVFFLSSNNKVLLDCPAFQSNTFTRNRYTSIVKTLFLLFFFFNFVLEFVELKEDFVKKNSKRE